MFHSFLSKFVIYRGVLLSSSFSQTWDRVFLAVSTCPSRIEPREHVQKIIGRSKKEVKCCKPISGSESNWGGYGSVFRTQEIEFFHAWSEQIGINRGAAACATFSRGPKWLKSHAHWGLIGKFIYKQWIIIQLPCLIAGGYYTITNFFLHRIIELHLAGMFNEFRNGSGMKL